MALLDQYNQTLAASAPTGNTDVALGDGGAAIGAAGGGGTIVGGGGVIVGAGPSSVAGVPTGTKRTHDDLGGAVLISSDSEGDSPLAKVDFPFIPFAHNFVCFSHGHRRRRDVSFRLRLTE